MSLRLTINLNVLSCPIRGKIISDILMAFQTKVAAIKHDEDITSQWVEDTVKGLVATSGTKDNPDEMAEAVLSLMACRGLSASFGPHINQLIRERSLTIYDTIFTTIYAAANLNTAAAADAATMNQAMTKRDFVRAAALCYEYMELQRKQVMRAAGEISKYDN